MLKKKYNQVLLSGKIGDGCLVNQGINSYISYNSINLDYLSFKRDQLSKFLHVSQIGLGKSGYKEGNTHYKFHTRVHPTITQIHNLTILECIESLNKEGLIMFYLDDGSYHKSRHFTHLYCNTFTEIEVETLVDKIWEIYPIKRCVVGYDRKKDGRSYPYVRINVPTTTQFLKDVKEFVIKNELYSIAYKAGLPSETIESIPKELITCSLEKKRVE